MTLASWTARVLLQAKMQKFQGELSHRGTRGAYFTGVPNDLLAIVEVDHCVLFSATNDGLHMVEIGYSLDPDDGMNEWGIDYNETVALRYALGAWLPTYVR